MKLLIALIALAVVVFGWVVLFVIHTSREDSACHRAGGVYLKEYDSRYSCFRVERINP